MGDGDEYRLESLLREQSTERRTYFSSLVLQVTYRETGGAPPLERSGVGADCWWDCDRKSIYCTRSRIPSTGPG